MKLLHEWGFTSESWKGSRGEYWVLLQAVLLMAFVALPIYRPAAAVLPAPPALYGLWASAAILGMGAATFIGKGLVDLGANLTPLPHPKEDGHLVQSGVYQVVRHPLYSGLILAAIGWAIAQLSVSHLVGALIFLVFFDAKANREEAWLAEKYPDYSDYRQRVKKLIPWVY